MAKFIAVGSYCGPIEAHLAKGRLTVEGIPAWLAHEHHVWADWCKSQALGGVRIYVPEKYAVSAFEILSVHNSGANEQLLNDIGINIDEFVCPQCGSNQINSKFPLFDLLLAVISLSVAVVLPPRRIAHRCCQCGNKWDKS